MQDTTPTMEPNPSADRTDAAIFEECMRLVDLGLLQVIEEDGEVLFQTTAKYEDEKAEWLESLLN